MRFLVIAAVALLVPSGCGPMPTLHRPTPATFDNSLVLREVDQLWSRAGSQAGGYRLVPDLSAPPSLYATAWMLQLVSLYGLRVDNLAPSVAAAWLNRILEDPEIDQEPIPVLQKVWLATRALHELSQPVGATAVRLQLERCRTGAHFSYTPGEPVSWAATQTAVEVMQASGLSMPPPVVAAVEEGFSRMPDLPADPVTGDRTLANVIIPLWQLADSTLSWDSRRPMRGRLEGTLRRMVSRAADPDVSVAFSAHLLVSERQIALANRTAVPVSIPASLGSPRPDGYFALSGSGAFPDPQLTFNAGLLGLPPSAGLAESITGSAGPRGWRLNDGGIDPEASFYALATAHALRSTANDVALAQQTRSWLAELSTTPMHLARDEPRRTFFVLALARVLGVEVAPSVRHGLEEDLANAPTNEAPSRVLLGLRIRELIGAPVSPDLKRRALEALDSITGKQMRYAYWLETIGRVTGDRALRDRARRMLPTLRSDAAYREATQAPVADLRATAFGSLLLGAAAGGRDRAVEPFRSREGAWMHPVTDRADNSLTLESIYLGYLTQDPTAGVEGVVY